MKDPEGANFDRVQIIKGWLAADGTAHEKIYEVTWAGDRKLGLNGKLTSIGSTVDIANASYTNSIGGAAANDVLARPAFRSQAKSGLLHPRSRNPDTAMDGV